MTCPSCGAASLSPLSGTCELCGYTNAAPVALERDDRVADLARSQLAHEFDLVDPVGRSPRSAVFIARERSSGREVMLKVMERASDRRDADAIFRAALALAATLDHPHLVPVLRFGVTDSLFWFTRENLRATPLADVLRQGTRLDVRQCRRMATQLASALDYLHRRGTIHGAVKPANVLLDTNGWVHLCDPAIPTERQPRTRTPVGGLGDLRSPAIDQRALAEVLYQSVTGVAPDPGLSALLADSTIPSAFGSALSRALDPEPRNRFPSITDFIWALESGAPPVAPASPVSTSPGVMFVPDWEAPADPQAIPRRIAKVALALAAILGLWFGLPALVRAVRPARNYEPVLTTPVVAPPATRPAPVEPPAARTPAPERAPERTPVAAPAFLSINATPWGRVSVDGTDVGNTPRRNLEVAAGTRVVRIARDGYLPFERTLRFAPNDTLRLTDIVLVPRPR